MTVTRSWKWRDLFPQRVRTIEPEAGQTVLDFLRNLTESECAQLGWQRRFLRAGDELFREGDPALHLYLVDNGALTLTVGGVDIATISPGESLGESSVFFEQETRMGGVTAAKASVLYALSRERLVELRDAHPAIYDLLLREALREAWERVARMEARVRTDPPSAPGHWPEARRPVGEAPITLMQALRELPGLHWMSAQIIAQIFSVARPRFVAAGEALFHAGDAGTAMYVVAEGRMALMRDTETELVSLGFGSLFGAGGFVARAPRLVAAVADEPTWVLELGADVWEMPEVPRRVLLESVLTALRLQLGAANQIVIEHKALQQGIEAMPARVAAAAQLQGWRAGDPMTAVGADDITVPAAVPPMDVAFSETTEMIRNAIIGRDVAIDTPFGQKRVIYADYTASGRSLAFVEDFLRQRVMPLYANTHTEASASGLQTTHLREEARAAIAKSVNANDSDEVIFVGSGATGAINRIVDILGLRLGPSEAQDAVPQAERPVVFIGPYEHHSNILPWRHSRADVVEIPVNADGCLDLEALEAALKSYRKRPLRIGSFSAASNVTGLATPREKVAQLLHAHGALSFWDYAAAGPYVPIDMNPDAPGAHKDAIFLSPHKFVGGPGTPGLLILKKALVKSAVPTHPGGGTVDFVTASDSLYSKSIADREEAGTPAILESIRCGMVFQLKDRVGADKIHQMETRYVRSAIDSWSRNPKLRVLGPLDAERISIVSFLVRHGRGYLHYNFVVALLNDLFGLQARGGCSCAGPYGARLLGLDEEASDAYLGLTQQGLGSYKPGWARVNFNYFIDATEFRYIVEAVHLVALYGYAMLPDYVLDPATGIWTHKAGQPYVPASLSEMRFENGKATWASTAERPGPDVLASQLAEGRALLQDATHAVPVEMEAAPEDPMQARWRWFPLPQEQAAWLRHMNGADPAPPEETPEVLADIR